MMLSPYRTYLLALQINVSGGNPDTKRYGLKGHVLAFGHEGIKVATTMQTQTTTTINCLLDALGKNTCPAGFEESFVKRGVTVELPTRPDMLVCFIGDREHSGPTHTTLVKRTIRTRMLDHRVFR